MDERDVEEHGADAMNARAAPFAQRLLLSIRPTYTFCMALSRTRLALIAATLLSGLLAGGNVDRAFVAMPAWQNVGATSWAEFSRHADLGNGLILYPVEAFGGFLFTLAAAVSLYLDRTADRRAAWALYTAAVLCAGGLAFTVMAAPIMLGIRGTNDPAALQTAFEDFWFWGNLRAVCQISAFVLQVWALAVLPRGS
jgi:hypothetical protein